MTTLKEIFIKGAKENNLKNIDVRIPRDKMVVLTGLSGSGKTSLAFDTIYAEGQRRYVESLSAYARQFLGQMDKPDVEFIEGLSPAISIDQKTTSKNPRSTVGTVTEIHDYLRLLFARIGKPHCPICGKPIESQSVDQIVDALKEIPDGVRYMVLAPIVRDRKGEHVKLLEKVAREGFTRVVVDGEVKLLGEDEIKLGKNFKHSIEIVVDRLVGGRTEDSRLAEAVETAQAHGNGLVMYELLDDSKSRRLFSTKFACPDHGVSIEELEPRMFSFNSPFGACESCNGLGFNLRLMPKMMVDKDAPLLNGGLSKLFAFMEYSLYHKQVIRALAHEHGVDLRLPLSEMPDDFMKEVYYGTGERHLKYTVHSKSGRTQNRDHTYEGLVNQLERKYRETASDFVKEKMEAYMELEPCKECQGKRLKPEVLAVTVGDLNIAQISDLSIKDAIEFFDSLQLSEKDAIIGYQILREIKERLKFLVDVGLDYLTLSRGAATLSGGETQRIRLASQIGSGLMGVLYILDEPSIGLHQRDNDRLLKTLRHLTDVGNTLLIVEHDEDTMYAADHIVDIGPGAGVGGGRLIAQGTVEDIKSVKDSITGQYLSGRKKILVPDARREGNGKFIKINGAIANNLKNIEVEIPLGRLVCVTGVSGSGKSSLVNQVLYAGLKNLEGITIGKGKGEKLSAVGSVITASSSFASAKELLKKYKELKDSSIGYMHSSECRYITGLENIDKVVDIDQSPIGRTPRSNPATYTGMMTPIRDLFASLPEAKLRGYTKSRFSFNVKGGRCEACKGDGMIKIEMHFLSDVYVPCDVCKGKRYNRETLEVKYKGKSIFDVLNMTVSEACDFFKNIPSIMKQLNTLKEVGLGYIKLGQPSTQLSGGEAQRVKLASELSKKATGRTLYILDEPTTGLHFADVDRLVHVLEKLVDAGNTVLVIEHNLDVIKRADYIIDLGPEGGNGGGEVIAKGTPEDVIKIDKSYTGRFLKKHIERL